MSVLTCPVRENSLVDTVCAIKSCYGTDKWAREISELFPETELGCINYGYWEGIAQNITIAEREESQIALYLRLFEFAEMSERKGASVLEVGCGRGHGIHLLSANGFNGVGIDLVERQISRCRRNYPSLKFSRAPAHCTGMEESQFDYVVSVEAAQHFHCFQSFCGESRRVLRKGGVFAITTFFLTSEHSQEPLLKILPEDVSGIHRAIPIADAVLALQNVGFNKISISPIGDKVFSGFSSWAAQSMSAPNHTPKWVDAFDKGLIDYYLVRGEL